jgi:hypothetical protein
MDYFEFPEGSDGSFVLNDLSGGKTKIHIFLIEGQNSPQMFVNLRHL